MYLQIFLVKPLSSGLNSKKIALKQKMHVFDRMVMANTGSASKYSNLVEVITFLEFYSYYCQNLSTNLQKI